MIHIIGYEILFVSNKSQIGNYPVALFLTTQFNKMENNNMKELKMVIIYIHAEINLPLMLREYYINIVKWWE